MRNFYLTNRFFLIFAAITSLFVIGFWFEPLFIAAKAILVMGIGLLIADIITVFRQKQPLKVSRKTPELLSLGDKNNIIISITNLGSLPIQAEIFDEIPAQLQIRDFRLDTVIRGQKTQELIYDFIPAERGEYHFGSTMVYISSPIGLVQRGINAQNSEIVPVYPSVLQMKKFELKAFTSNLRDAGIKKLRRTGQSFEFDQLKEYVQGDDRRAINWKASSRRGELMVNHFRDERSQQVYCIIDKSRSMKMPFDGLTLMDHAINASLVISNIVLQKGDRAGLMTFSDRLGGTIAPERSPRQLQLILEQLYREQLRPAEADYELLYQATRKLIRARSLLLLFTNFESRYALDRVLPLLRNIGRSHLLVVIFFENTEVRALAETQAETLEDIYHQTIAQKFLQEKKEVMYTLRQYGIQTILTTPRDLTVNTINKYLELKSRGMI